MKKILIFSLLLVACRPASVIPTSGDGGIPGPGDEKTVSIAFLKTLYTGAPTRIDNELRISGAVVSDDRQGNFHKTLVLDDGTAGIEVRVDIDEIFKTFMIHTRATVRCNGLWIGSYGGTLQLGAEPFDNRQTQPLSEVEVAEHIAADNVVYGEVKPATLTFNELSPRRVSTFVAFEGVRFIPEERGLGWAEADAAEDGSEPPAATDRHLVNAAGDTLIVRTSRYARFATWLLPEVTGRIEGVLGIFNGDYQLVVTDSEKFTPLKD
ncbi:MAG: DUF5689 domain-containing protein [Alistipes sp.]|jgi:hypothetical protein|nr:DUF5689 domain-containing protein [Alistipes sp.]